MGAHGGSGGATGPWISLRRVAASALGAIGAAVGAVAGELTVADSEA